MPDDSTTLKERFIELSKPLSPLPTDTEPVLQTLTDIRFAIFDFYGTLFISGVGDIGIDENSQDTSLLEEVLVVCGYETTPDASGQALQTYEEVVKLHSDRLIKDGADFPEPAIDQVWYDVLQKLQRSKKIRGNVSLQNARKFAVEFEARMNPIWPMPGVRELLTSLRAKNLELGIISNS
ncbi:MAG: hypothetical protein WD599_01660, partial [Balneolaceae bacterium]